MPNLLKLKRGLAATIPTASLAEPLFTTDTYDLYIGNGTGNTRFQKYIASGTTSQYIKGDGSLGTHDLDSLTDVVITSATSGQVLKYDGTNWINGTDTDTGITSLNGLTATTQTFAVGTSGTDFGISSATSTHTFNLPTASATNRGALSSADWSTFNSKEPAITAGTSLQYYRGDKTFQTLNTSVVPESGAIYFTEPRVLATVLTGLNLTGGGTIAATDSVLTAFGKVQNQISALVGGATYQGTWNASTNSPTLASGTGTKGFYYVVNVAGSTNLDGITDWKVGDWAIFNGTTWDKVDNTDAVSSVNGFTGAVNLGLGDISNVALSSPTNAQLLYFNGTSSKWENWTPTFEPALTKGNLTEATSSVLTISGGSNAVIGSGTSIQVKQASGSQSGYLSSTDWTTFNNKQAALTNPVTGTGTNNEIAYFNATGSTIASLSTATYPSLTELSYVKGVTSAIQTQLDGKLTGNQTITLSGDVSGSGATAITTTIGAGKVTNAMLAGSITASKLATFGAGDAITWSANTDTGFIKFVSSGDGAGQSYMEIGTTDNDDEPIKFTQSGNVRVQIGTDGKLKNGAGTEYITNSGTWAISTTGSAATLTTARNFTINGTAKSFDGSANVSWTDAEIGLTSYLPLSGGTLTGALSGTSATFSGNVVLGTTALSGGGAAQWLTANGTAYGGGLISSVNGVIKSYYYYDSSGYAFVQGAAGVGVKLVVDSTINALTIASTGAATFSSSVTATQGNFSLGTVGGSIGSVKNITASNTNGAIGDFAGLNFAYYNNTTNFGYIGTVLTSDAGNSVADMVFGVKASTSVTSVTEYMRIKAGGSIGIGTSSPDANSKLDVNGQAFVAQLAIYNNNGTPSLGTSPLLYSPASATLAISTGSTERMRITSGGVVLVANSSGTQPTIVGSERMNINGTVYATGFFESSDIRFKNVLNTIESNNISAINYTWKDGRNTKKHWGYSAQDVMQILPDAVEGSEDKFYVINYNEVHTWKIAQLEAEIKELKAKLAN